MRYPGDCRCVFSTGLHRVACFDERLCFVSPDCLLDIVFPSPFLKSAPTLVQLHRQHGASYHVETITTSYQEAFKEELVHFHECIEHDRTPRTNAVDSRKDYQLLLDIVQAYRAGQRH